jgi:hypothetical protein
VDKAVTIADNNAEVVVAAMTPNNVPSVLKHSRERTGLAW